MNDNGHRAYFLRRAREERAIASCCADSAVALTHFRFAEEYERRAAEIEREPQFGNAAISDKVTRGEAPRAS